MAPEYTTHETERIELGRLPSGTSIASTVHRYGDGDTGKTVYVQALQHGREVNGLEVLRRIHDRLLDERVRGQVVAVPVANPLSFDHRRYLAPPRLDALNANMNRLWPGDPDGTLLEGMVARLWSVVREADVVVDLHTGTPAMLSHTRYSPGDPRSRDLAAAFGLDVIVADGEDLAVGEGNSVSDDPRTEQGLEREQHRDRGRKGGTERGKLREAAGRAGIPSITPELAHSRAVVEGSVERGVRGVENVLNEVGVLDGRVPEANPTRAVDRSRISARASGMFRPADVDVGDRLDAGSVIGEVYDPTSFDVLQTVEVDRDGMLLTLKPGLAVIAGETLASTVSVEGPS